MKKDCAVIMCNKKTKSYTLKFVNKYWANIQHNNTTKLTTKTLIDLIPS